MSKPKKPVQDSGPIQESQESLSSAESQPKTILPESGKEPQTSQSKNGSVNSQTSKNSSESEQDSGTKTIIHQISPQKLSKQESKTRRELAIKRLKVKPESLATVPEITPILKQDIRGGLRTALAAMRLGIDDPDIAIFIKKYDSISPSDIRSLPWEAICLSAGINTKHLLGAIKFAVDAYCATKSRFIAVTNHPATMKARAKYALLSNGDKDRTAHDIIVGAQQSNKGPTFIGKAVFGGSGTSSAVGKDDEDDTPTQTAFSKDEVIEQLFPSPVRIQEKLIPIRQRLLEG